MPKLTIILEPPFIYFNTPDAENDAVNVVSIAMQTAYPKHRLTNYYYQLGKGGLAWKPDHVSFGYPDGLSEADLNQLVADIAQAMRLSGGEDADTQTISWDTIKEDQNKQIILLPKSEATPDQVLECLKVYLRFIHAQRTKAKMMGEPGTPIMLEYVPPREELGIMSINSAAPAAAPAAPAPMGPPPPNRSVRPPSGGLPSSTTAIRPTTNRSVRTATGSLPSTAIRPNAANGTAATVRPAASTAISFKKPGGETCCQSEVDPKDTLIAVLVKYLTQLKTGLNDNVITPLIKAVSEMESDVDQYYLAALHIRRAIKQPRLFTALFFGGTGNGELNAKLSLLAEKLQGLSQNKSMNDVARLVIVKAIVMGTEVANEGMPLLASPAR